MKPLGGSVEADEHSSQSRPSWSRTSVGAPHTGHSRVGVEGALDQVEHPGVVEHGKAILLWVRGTGGT